MTSEGGLQEFVDRLLAADSDHEVYQAGVDIAAHILDADTVEVVSTSDEELQVLARSASSEGTPPSEPSVAPDLLAQTDLIGKSHRFDDITDVRSAATTASASDTAYIPRALLVVPIDDIGLLLATDGTPAAFTEHDQAWAEYLAAAITRAVRPEEAVDASEPTQLERIAQILSHDFAGPLTVARGAIELAEETGDPEHFERANKALDRIEDLIEGVEELARTDDHVGTPELLQLREVVKEVWPSVETGEASLEIASSRSIVGDRQAVYQLLMNLFVNAIEHGGEDVTVQVGVTPGGFYVSDDGPGVPPHERHSIFEWGEATADDHKGIGLGIVKQICDAHGWEIEVTEADAGGARFEITT